MVGLYAELEKNINGKLQFDSAYKYYGAAQGKKDKQFPNYTNYTKKFKGTLDHLFFTSKNLEPL